MDISTTGICTETCLVKQRGENYVITDYSTYWLFYLTVNPPVSNVVYMYTFTYTHVRKFIFKFTIFRTWRNIWFIHGCINNFAWCVGVHSVKQVNKSTIAASSVTQAIVITLDPFNSVNGRNTFGYRRSIRARASVCVGGRQDTICSYLVIVFCFM